MKRANYDQIERDVAAQWRAQKNLDNDPVTFGQIRAAEVQGKLAAFMAKEIDSYVAAEGTEAFIPLLPHQILAAIFANEALNLAKATNDPGRTALMLLEFAAGFLGAMVKSLAENGSTPPEGTKGDGIVFGGSIPTPHEDVPN